MGRVRVEIQDAATGKPTAARIYGVASDGKFYAPRDEYARIGELGEHLFHTEGRCLLEVPTGRIVLEAVKGFEYWPTKKELEVKPGETSRVTLVLKRMVELAAVGWVSGSTHVHMNYGGNLHNSLDNLIRMSRAEDQGIIDELVANKDNRILDWQFFASGGGEHPASKKDPAITLIVGEEYRPPFYGHGLRSRGSVERSGTGNSALHTAVL